MADRPKVVKLAQPGYDVHTAGDENLIYNSNWPLLKIYKQGSFSLSRSGQARNVITEHDLGYIPAFWIFGNGQETDTYDQVGRPSEVSQFGADLQFTPAATATNLTYDLNVGGLGGTVKFYWYLFALDITKAYEAPKINVGRQAASGSGDKVFKLAKPGKDLSSQNLEDYIIHSETRSPLVHAVYPGVTGNDATVPGGIGATFYHNLGYVPMTMCYVDNTSIATTGATPNAWELFPGDGSTGAGVHVDTSKVQFAFPLTGQKFSIIVLKDPFTADFSVDVNI